MNKQLSAYSCETLRCASGGGGSHGAATLQWSGVVQCVTFYGRSPVLIARYVVSGCLVHSIQICLAAATVQHHE